MIPAPTIAYWTQLAQVSSGLAADYNRKRDQYYGGAGEADKRTAFLLSFYSDIIAWTATNLPGTQQLSTISLYTYSLCGRFIPAAAQIINGGMTGVPVTPGGGTQPTFINYQNDFTVGDPDSPILAGANQYTINIGKGRKWSLSSVNISKDQVLLPQNKIGYDSYNATYDTSTGLITVVFNFNAQNLQLFIVTFNYITA